MSDTQGSRLGRRIVQHRKVQARALVAAVDIDALSADPLEQRWSRRSRFLFIVAAASLCWALPSLAVYAVLRAF
jgi:hypothetical protein